MTDRPILFSASMVRALLDGRKTQTRRILNVQPPRDEDFPGSSFALDRAPADHIKILSHNNYDTLQKHPTKWDLFGSVGRGRDAGFPMTYDARFAIGDRLWVRETWALAGIYSDVAELRYRASKNGSHTDFVEQVPARHANGYRITWPKYKPSIHMPRWASRITLTVTDVRVQRVQNISEGDANAEGCFVGKASRRVFESRGHMQLGGPQWPTASAWFAYLWESIHGLDAWRSNPWVIAISFTVAKHNIDADRKA